MPVLEIVSFPASEAYLKDPEVFKDALVRVVKAEGCLSAHYGLQSEDSKTGYVLIVWETYEHHATVMAAPDYPEVIKSLFLAIAPGEKPEILHVPYTTTSSNFLLAGVTEIAMFTTTTTDTDKARAVYENLAEEINKSDEGLNLPCAWGETREKSGTWIFGIGWKSVDHHYDVIKAPVYQEILKNLNEVCTLDVKHVALTKFVA